MANLEIEEEPMLSPPQRSHGLQGSDFRARSRSMHIPMVSHREATRTLDSVKTFPQKKSASSSFYSTATHETLHLSSSRRGGGPLRWHRAMTGRLQYNPLQAEFDSIFEGSAWRVPSFCSSCVPGVIHPDSVKQWNKIIAILSLVAIFLDPLFFFLLYVEKHLNCIVISWTMTRPLILLRSINDLVYFMNMLLQFRLAYVSAGSRLRGTDLIDDPKKIARHYLTSYFFLDLFIALPLPQIIVLFVLPRYFGASHAESLLCGVILVQYIPRLFRFLPLLIVQSPEGFIFESAWANFFINILIFILSGHVVGSCWYLFGLQRVNQCLRDACHNSVVTQCMKIIDCGYDRFSHYTSSDSEMWRNNANATACLNSSSGAFDYGIYANVVQLTTHPKIVKKYLYALYWGFQQISTLAGNQTPSDFEFEVLFIMAITGIGLLLFALLIGNIQNYLQALGQRLQFGQCIFFHIAYRTLEMQLRGRDVEQWMSQFHLPEDLRRKIRHVERYNWAATIGVNAEMLMENMPEDLQRDIRRHLFRFIKRVRIFSMMDEPILDAICEKLRHKIYIKGSNILYNGGLVEKMVFVMHGKLESIEGEDGIRISLTQGDACGEELLQWCLENSLLYTASRKPEKVLRSERTVRALTNVEVFSLRADDLEEVIIRFSRLFQRPRVQAALRYESPYWRSLAATRIQMAWRNRKNRLNRKRAASQTN
ncbi:probable cyclic nucleotide-gated ion channel 20, chloroplastic isoform X1 [Arachis duranensis]|uniref:Probable cyclic nucleotide-gated ion channel 20, chloroplastic isoform X1 n=1 Tax=Arachis duranensis TaxID=130453 RepID=A0A9C6TW44_ARADU|nr:probable cyclic nucleotide-gated ion channel 20, chloroplastic isoform X1 [Arachis duranensis]XP_052118134.1 probable cyclic nucleotide-gated ion channel 20, chloroplastic isoform X1 [Arachis duranensis]